MALPSDIRAETIAIVAAYCATRTPADLNDQVRIEYQFRGSAITIAERRPP